MTEEEYEAYIHKKHEKSLKERAQTSMWDYEHHQYSIAKHAELRELLTARKMEIQQNEEQFSQPELKKIEGILNGLSK